MRPLLRWYRGRVVLLGDAAHGMLPHHGQGANTSIEDAFTLAALLAEAEAADFEPVLSRFQSMRRARTRKIQRSSWVTNTCCTCFARPRGPGARRHDGRRRPRLRLDPRVRRAGGVGAVGGPRFRPRRPARRVVTRTGRRTACERTRCSPARRGVGAAAGIDPGRVTPQARLDEDLGIDSLTLVDVVVALEDQFGLVIPDDDWSRFRTIGDISAHLQKAAVLRR